MTWTRCRARFRKRFGEYEKQPLESPKQEKSQVERHTATSHPSPIGCFLGARHRLPHDRPAVPEIALARKKRKKKSSPARHPDCGQPAKNRRFAGGKRANFSSPPRPIVGIGLNLYHFLTVISAALSRTCAIFRQRTVFTTYYFYAAGVPPRCPTSIARASTNPIGSFFFFPKSCLGACCPGAAHLATCADARYGRCFRCEGFTERADAPIVVFILLPQRGNKWCRNTGNGSSPPRKNPGGAPINGHVKK